MCDLATVYYSGVVTKSTNIVLIADGKATQIVDSEANVYQKKNHKWKKVKVENFIFVDIKTKTTYFVDTCKGVVTKEKCKEPSTECDSSSSSESACGPCGENNIPGPRGPQGITGPAGPVGPQGPPGSASSTGAQGPTGGPGPAGAQGGAGPQGMQGIQGITGAAGPIGPQGAPGVSSYEQVNITSENLTTNTLNTAGSNIPGLVLPIITPGTYLLLVSGVFNIDAGTNIQWQIAQNDTITVVPTLQNLLGVASFDTTESVAATAMVTIGSTSTFTVQARVSSGPSATLQSMNFIALLIQ